MPVKDLPALRDWIASRSFRLKLVALVLLAETLTLGLVLWQGRQLLDAQLREQVQSRVAQIDPLLEAALALPLAQRDYAAVRDIAQQAMTGNSLVYLRVENRERKPVAHIGQTLPEPAPPPAGNTTKPEERIDVDLPLTLYGENLGMAHYGVSLTFLAEARQRLTTQVLQAGAVSALLVLVLLIFFASGMMRRLARIERAADALAAGDMAHRIESLGDSEIDHLGRTFNHMADALQERIAEVRQINADLEARVSARTAELSVARDAAERLTRVKSEFLANMSHEIRTPMNGVLGMAQIGRRQCSDPRAKENFDRILLSGRLLLGIINDILDFSKIEAGKLAVENTPFPLADTLRHVVDLLRDQATDNGIALTLEISPELPARCLGDPLRLGQVLLNLLGNAVKFTERGTAGLSATRDGDTLVLCVTDSGIGMNPQQIERLFQPFEQAESSTTRRFGGTGLGLAIGKRLVELMGGTLTVESTPGRGSLFEVRLPFVAAPDAPGETKTDPTADTRGKPRLAGLRILVAEDNEINRFVLEDNLIEEGARVTLVGDGRQAVERVETDGGAAYYDIVLMDVMMPEMDGYEATRKIRALAPGLPIIGQTAHALAEEHARCRAAGMAELITKPINSETLVATILRHVHPRNLS